MLKLYALAAASNGSFCTTHGLENSLMDKERREKEEKEEKNNQRRAGEKGSA